MKNLINSMSPALKAKLADFKVTEVFVDRFGELHVTSEYDMPDPSWMVAIGKEVYNILTEANDHTAAAKLLVDFFGTDTEREEMEEIYARTWRAPFISDADYNRRFEISNKYYANLIAGDKLYFANTLL